MKQYKVKEDCVGSKQLLHFGARVCTTGQLKKGTIVELIENPEAFPLVRTVFVPPEKREVYQIVKDCLEEVK